MTAADSTASSEPTAFTDTDYDFRLLPGWDNDFIDADAIDAFARALAVPDPATAVATSPDSTKTEHPQKPQGTFITALNDWKPIRQRARRDYSTSQQQQQPRRRKKTRPRRGRDETREGFVYTILQWPLLVFVLTWIVCLGAAYIVTRLYVWAYEQLVTVRGGEKEKLRRALARATSYDIWVREAKRLDTFLGNDRWKQEDDYAYYNSNTVRTVRDSLKRLRLAIEQGEAHGHASEPPEREQLELIAEELRALVEASAKDNFVGTENAHLYSETYYGTKHLVQSFTDEVQRALKLLHDTQLLSDQAKGRLFERLAANFGRTALCLSGGATFAYYHFGIAKALLDAGVLPEVIAGTSGGALVAALLATRTDDELRTLLVPALAHRITACGAEVMTFRRIRRWWRTGANFDSVDWARACSWFCHGSLTFREAYERTGRVLNVTCIPSDPHSPAVLANHLTSPDCVVWSAVLASAAVPGILNPVVLMKKTPEGRVEPFSFGHRWKDGSLRTDIPLKALNTQFNVSFSIVSQANPHINLFFFSSRGTVGRPVTHRSGRGWRGGFLGSATEQYLKLDLTKWLKVLRHLELLPRYAGQDWSRVWLQPFSGTVTVWPRVAASDFAYILSDPPPGRLARMLTRGMQAAFPKLKFVMNRVAVERRVFAGLRSFGGAAGASSTTAGAATATATGRPRADTAPLTPGSAKVHAPMLRLSEDDLRGLLAEARRKGGDVLVGTPDESGLAPSLAAASSAAAQSASVSSNATAQSSNGAARSRDSYFPSTPPPVKPRASQANGAVAGGFGTSPPLRRDSTMMQELTRQTRVFFDDTEVEGGFESEVGSAAGSTAGGSNAGSAVESALESEGEDDGAVGGRRRVARPS